MDQDFADYIESLNLVIQEPDDNDAITVTQEVEDYQYVALAALCLSLSTGLTQKKI